MFFIFVFILKYNTYVEREVRTYLIDVSKYVLTGIVIASLFKDLGESKLLIYVLGLLVACLLAGLVLSNKKEEK